VNAGDWIEVILGGPTIMGGGCLLVAKLTRIAVAVENLVRQMGRTAETVADHEKRLNKAGL
jgi:hypothetical protein